MDDINIRHIFAFLVSARFGSMTAAAQSIGRSQPTVSTSVNLLEGQLSAALLHRGKAGVSLAPAGKCLASRAETAFTLLQNTIIEISGCDKHTSYKRVLALTNAQLKALLAISDSESFAAASRALNIATPTLHRSARDLEQFLNVLLFERTSFGIRPTRSAVKLADVTGLVFAELRQARQEISALQGLGQGDIRIGAMPLARAFLAPMAATSFTNRFDGASASLVEAPFEDLVRGLRRGTIDCLIGAERGGRLAGIVEDHIFSDDLSILMRPSHPLAQKKTLSKRDLHRFPWITPRKSSPLRKQLVDLLGSAPEASIECNSFSAARIILMNCDRLMLLSDAQAKIELDHHMLVSKKPPGKVLTRSIALFSRKGWAPTKAQAVFIDELRGLAVEKNAIIPEAGHPVTSQ